MEINLLLIPMINLIILSFLKIKEFFINPLFNNGFMGYFIKWTSVASYGAAFIICIISIYFLAIAIINIENDHPMKAKNNNKIGMILYLISTTLMALTMILLIIFK